MGAAVALAPEPLYPGATIAGRFTLRGLIASGGTSTVWAATDRDGFFSNVALKIMSAKSAGDPIALERIRREAEIGYTLEGPHFARTITHGVHHGLGFLAQELLYGETLADRLKRYGRMSPGECMPWLVQLASGLADAHKRGVIHRDLSPRNVFFARQGDREVLKILDFGIAVSPAFANKTALTEPGKVIGSIHYLAPEQLQREPVDARTDMWALAVILYRSVLGRRPFEGDGLVPLAAILREDPPPPSVVLPGVSPAVDAFFRRALCKDPDGRFPTLDELVIAFEALAVGMAAPSLQAPRIPSDAPTRILALGDGRREPGRWQIYAAAAVFPIVLVVLAFLAR